jgi:transcriptional regulator MraZ
VEYSQLPVFKGSYRHKIDPKGRLPVPAAFRRALRGAGADAVVATILDQCVAVYSPAEWGRLEAQLDALPAFGRAAKALTRLLASRAVDCDLDVQGRILLPAALREAAGLGRDAVVVGVLNRFEGWSPEAWERFVRDSEAMLEDASLDVQWPPPPRSTEPPPTASRPARPQGKPNR